MALSLLPPLPLAGEGLMLYCFSCAKSFDERFGHRGLSAVATEFQDPRNCEFCKGPGPCTGTHSKDVISGACGYNYRPAA